jgi:beta-glucosidase
MSEKDEKYELKFPRNFMWGTSTSAHQVEGQNIFNDWWPWEQEGHILNKQVSGDAANHYNMYRKDFDMMKGMHHNTHRISIEWSRIEQKEGEFNEYEIKHYRNVLEYMKKSGIKPIVTLYHFTLPYWFMQKGGFLHKDARKIFNRFVKRVSEEFGDLVEYWVTINEPYVYADNSYWEGKWPPGERSIIKFLRVLKELLRVHCDSYQVIKEVYRNKGWKAPQVGFSKSFIWFDPYKKKSIMSYLMSEIYRYFYNKTYFRPFYSGHFPFILGYGEIPEALECLDFIGMNYYFRCKCKFDPLKSPMMVKMVGDPNAEKSLFDWEVYPEGMYNLMKVIYRNLKKPIIVTENGISTLNDNQRISYIIRHLDSVYRAMRDGVDVRGYLYWSFIDNFEWSEGYTQPFGLVAMNQKTFARIPKPSARVYSEICKEGKVTEHMIKKYAHKIYERHTK